MPKRAIKFSDETSSSWNIDDIIDGPKLATVNGRKAKYYKVRWSESFEIESNIPKELIALYERKGKRVVKILGPLIEQNEARKLANENVENDDGNSTNRCNSSIDYAEFRPQQTKFAIEINGEVSLMTYKELKASYRDELLTYYEERAKIYHADT